MCEDRLNDELAAIEAALAGLKPARSRIDRGRLLSLAGRAPACEPPQKRRRNKTAWLWPCAAAAAALAAAVFLGVWLSAGGAPKGGEKVAGGPAQNPSAATKRLADGTAPVDVSSRASPPFSTASSSPAADFLWKAVLREGLREGIVMLAATAPKTEDNQATAARPVSLNPSLCSTVLVMSSLML
jgi:hypothetical protein